MKKETTKKTTLPVRTLETVGKKTIDVPAYFVSVPLISLARTIHTMQKRMRVRRAHTKEREEVAGGGRKPWKQKGTGRSRHGSIRSPLWVGGGITFGPRSRKTRVLKAQLKERRLALSGAFAIHVGRGSLSVLSLPKDIPSKTAMVAKQLKGVAHVLIILDDSHVLLHRAVRNIPSVTCKRALSVTPLDVLQAGQVWIDEQAMEVIAKRCSL